MSDACTCRINRRGRDGMPVSVDRDHDCPKHGVSCLVPLPIVVSLTSWQRELGRLGYDLHTPLWWLSFADGDLPVGSQFLGAAIVPGIAIGDAITNAHALGCNPGGEVQGFEIPGKILQLILDGDVGRLMNRAACEAFDARAKR